MICNSFSLHFDPTIPEKKGFTYKCPDIYFSIKIVMQAENDCAEYSTHFKVLHCRMLLNDLHQAPAFVPQSDRQGIKPKQKSHTKLKSSQHTIGKKNRNETMPIWSSTACVHRKGMRSVLCVMFIFTPYGIRNGEYAKPMNSERKECFLDWRMQYNPMMMAIKNCSKRPFLPAKAFRRCTG